MDNEKYMKRCYGLAVSAGKKGFDTFGALLVHDGEILEEAENTADWKKGIFGHAEFNLVHKCANRYPDNGIPAAPPASAAFAPSPPWASKTSSSAFPMRNFQN